MHRDNYSPKAGGQAVHGLRSLTPGVKGHDLQLLQVLCCLSLEVGSYFRTKLTPEPIQLCRLAELFNPPTPKHILSYLYRGGGAALLK